MSHKMYEYVVNQIHVTVPNASSIAFNNTIAHQVTHVRVGRRVTSDDR